MAGAVLELDMRFGKQGSRARDEEPHVLREGRGRNGDRPAGGCRRSAHPSSPWPAACGRSSDRDRISAGRSSTRPRPASCWSQRTARGCGRSAGRAAARRLSLNCQYSARVCALRAGFAASASRPWTAPSCPRCKGTRRGRLGFARHGVEVIRHRRGRSRERAAAVGVQSFDTRAAASGDRGEGVGLRAVADQQPCAGVFDEIAEFLARIAGVQRQEDDAGLHAGGVERQRLGRLLGLGGEAVAGFEAETRERVGDARSKAQKGVMRQGAAVGKVQKRADARPAWRPKRVSKSGLVMGLVLHACL